MCALATPPYSGEWSFEQTPKLARKYAEGAGPTQGKVVLHFPRVT